MKLKIFLLFLISAFIFAISGYLGIGSNPFSSELITRSPEEFEWLKSSFAAGRLILGLFYAALIIFFHALWFWTLTDVPYAKLVVLQSFIFPVLLAENTLNIFLAVQFNLPWFSSPFSLGPAAHYMMSHPFFIYFLGSISLFKFWVIAFQLYGLRMLSSQRPLILFMIIIGIHIISWIGKATLAFLDFKVIL
ncbi:hypothetical protein ACFSCZ_08895 [Siminovitchia sediminis]|uniref:Yip1 domain-containing protein n=1 Tax=Siminovitchia sediminis TaxID=1274353 RepID=A0ABW4KFN4_9BACI